MSTSRKPAAAPTQAAPAQPRRGAKVAPKSYHIVNPGGAVHQVTYELARELLGQPGYRMATAEEIRELRNRNGHQTFDDPIAPPWTAEPTPDPDLDELEQSALAEGAE